QGNGDQSPGCTRASALPQPPSFADPLPFKLSMMLYFLAVLLSAFVAEFPLAVLFYAWQLARMFLVYAAVTKAVSNDARVARALMTAMAVGLLVQAGGASWDRFSLGTVQAGGTVGAPNML